MNLYKIVSQAKSRKKFPIRTNPDPHHCWRHVYFLSLVIKVHTGAWHMTWNWYECYGRGFSWTLEEIIFLNSLYCRGWEGGGGLPNPTSSDPGSSCITICRRWGNTRIRSCCSAPGSQTWSPVSLDCRAGSARCLCTPGNKQIYLL